MAEPLGEQPTGSEGSSSPALRTYLRWDYFTRTPVNISDLSGECWGGVGSGLLIGDCFVRGCSIIKIVCPI